MAAERRRELVGKRLRSRGYGWRQARGCGDDDEIGFEPGREIIAERLIAHAAHDRIADNDQIDRHRRMQRRFDKPLDGRIAARQRARYLRSEAHTSELQSLMRLSYAVFCLNKKTKHDKQAT